jgi:hypothetical protein
LRHAFLAAQPHVRFALAQAAFPGEKAQQGQDRALKHTLAWETTILLVTTTGAGPHENLNGLKAGKR